MAVKKKEEAKKVTKQNKTVTKNTVASKTAKPSPKAAAKVVVKKAVPKTVDKKAIAPKKKDVASNKVQKAKAVLPARKAVDTKSKFEHKKNIAPKPVSKKSAQPVTAKKEDKTKLKTKPTIKQVTEKKVVKPAAKPILSAKKIEAKPVPKNKQVAVKKEEPKPKAAPVKKAPAPKQVKQEPAKAEIIKPVSKITVRYSDTELESFRIRIIELKKEAMEELSMLKDRLDDLNSYDFAEESMIYSMHMAEQGSEAMEKEKTYAQIQRINEYIKKLDEALERIKLKTYGVCRVCNCLIAKERLMAVPITTLSASYKIHKKCPDDGVDRIEPLKK
jgi:RNA polymerase-binding transcription factor DksA